jgi:hypothetical protein
MGITQSLVDALVSVHWLPVDLWVGAAAIGGHFAQRDIDDITSGHRLPTRAEYRVLAATLNERFAELGGDHPLPPWT